MIQCLSYKILFIVVRILLRIESFIGFIFPNHVQFKMDSYQ